MTQPLRLNPLFERVAGSDQHAFLRSNPDRVFALTPDTLALLEAFTRARPIAEVLPDAAPEQLAVIEQLVELELLLEPGASPPAWAWERASQPVFRTGHWPSPSVSSRVPVIIVGARFDGATSSVYPSGASKGPSVVRAAAWDFPFIARYGFPDVDRPEPLLRDAELRDAGDLVVEPGCTWSEFAGALRDRLARLGASGRCVLLGGDHSVTLPALEALANQHEAIGLLHFDAHADLGVEDQPARVSHANVMRHAIALPHVVSLVQVGVRGIQALPQPSPGYAHFSVAQARRSPEAIVAAMRADIPWYVSVDIDVLDPSVAPATGALEPDGLGLAELRGLLRACLTGRSLVGADLVEVQAQAGDRLTGRAAALVLIDLADLACSPPKP